MGVQDKALDLYPGMSLPRSHTSLQLFWERSGHDGDINPSFFECLGVLQDARYPPAFLGVVATPPIDEELGLAFFLILESLTELFLVKRKDKKNN